MFPYTSFPDSDTDRTIQGVFLSETGNISSTTAVYIVSGLVISSGALRFLISLLTKEKAFKKQESKGNQKLLFSTTPTRCTVAPQLPSV